MNAAAEGVEGIVVLTVHDGVATVRMNRPEELNALNLELKDALLATLQTVAADPAVRCVVLVGTGRGFCVGQDLKEHLGVLADRDPERMRHVVEDHYNPIVELLATMDKPVVAAVNGVAAGAGAAFAFACDLRIFADTASVNLAFAGVGLSCDSGSSWTLPRLVGPAKAKELLYLPRTVTAAQCLELGLATQVVPGSEFDETVRTLASRLAAGPTVAYGAIRRTVAFAAGHGLTEALAAEADGMVRSALSEDHLAAVTAFVEKRPAVFTGR